MYWHKVQIFLGFWAIFVYAEIREHGGPKDCRKSKFYSSTYLSFNSKSWRFIFCGLALYAVFK